MGGRLPPRPGFGLDDCALPSGSGGGMRRPVMAYVVADPCVKCKYTDCVAVCPVDCFYEGKNSLAINPDECIDCGACEPERPTTAIFEESELPTKWAIYKDINAVVSGTKKMDDVDAAAWPQHLKD